ncbi:MAG: gfo/Idh/MocA family oxidoreductase, partial [Planctomycetota bacterium]
MPVSRRNFVENALVLATAALAGVRPLASTAAETAASPAGPSDKIRVAVIGVNGRGGVHLGEWLANPDADVVAI